MRQAREQIHLWTPAQIAIMRRAGLVVARGLAAMREAAVPGASTLDLDAVGREVLREAGATPSFLNYHGFPGVICASINDKVVHGIPAASEKLADGDLISIDFGAIVDGWHGDSAISVAVGEVAPDVAELSRVTEASMWDGIAAVRAGGRLTDISHAVETSVRRAGKYGIVTGYGGHGIGTEMHMAPHILNYGKAGKGPPLVSGMAVAIEPMVTLGTHKTQEHDDGWTVSTVDGSWASHWEHTVALFDDGPWVLTAVDGGREELGKRGVTLSAAAA